MALAGQGGAGRREGTRLARSAGLGFQSLKCHVKKLGLPWGSHQEDDLIRRPITAVSRHWGGIGEQQRSAAPRGSSWRACEVWPLHLCGWGMAGGLVRSKGSTLEMQTTCMLHRLWVEGARGQKLFYKLNLAFNWP